MIISPPLLRSPRIFFEVHILEFSKDFAFAFFCIFFVSRFEGRCCAPGFQTFPPKSTTGKKSPFCQKMSLLLTSRKMQKQILFSKENRGQNEEIFMIFSKKFSKIQKSPGKKHKKKPQGNTKKFRFLPKSEGKKTHQRPPTVENTRLAGKHAANRRKPCVIQKNCLSHFS